MKLGRLPKSRNERKIAREKKAEVKAELSAKAEWDKTKLGRQKKLEEKLWNLVDRIDPNNIPKWATIFVLAWMIKHAVDWAEDLVIKAVKGAGWITELYTKLSLYPMIFQWQAKPVAKTMERALAEPTVEIAEWLLSFAAAYLIVEHAGEILQAGGSLLGSAKSLLMGLGALG